jgi:hypothetical protein
MSRPTNIFDPRLGAGERLRARIAADIKDLAAFCGNGLGETAPWAVGLDPPARLWNVPTSTIAQRSRALKSTVQTVTDIVM